MKYLKVIFLSVSWFISSTFAQSSMEVSLDEATQQYYFGRFEKAQELLRPLAEKGDPEAQYFLALSLVRRGGHTFADRRESGELLIRSAENGNPYAMWQLSDKGGSSNRCEFFGWPCGDKGAWKSQAVSRWEKLAKQGHPDAIAYYAWKSFDLRKFIPFYGYMNSQTNKAISLGFDYGAQVKAANLRKHSSEAQVQETIHYLKIAANRDHIPSLGELLALSDYLDEQTLYPYALRAAKLGYAPDSLSKFYEEGKGTEQSIYKAYKFMVVTDIQSKESRFDLNVAKRERAERLEHLAKKLTTAQRKQAEQEAQDWVVKYPKRAYGHPLDF